ncbi:MAG: metal ABC transporter ATP-binding protein [Campylobacteraceae bacterium]|jgi:zinc transport system ATP-binding protein|nr:metal ABC transporter ATP-binding protein [Campylobacteraceae bacterium]
MMLRVCGLSFAYDKESVLENVSFEYDKSDFLALVGPNGGGKSTLLKLILGLLKPTSGSVELSSHEIGYVPQNTMPNGEFPISVLDAALMGRLKNNRFGFYKKDDKKKALDALEKVGMREYAHKKIGELSIGQRQKVFIARALICEAKLLILDEPTASVDMQGQIQIYNILKSLNSTKGIIAVSHDMDVVLGYATKIAYVSRTLFMHEPSALTKEAFFEKLQSKGMHNCPVDVFMANTCLHDRPHKDS